MSSKTADTNHWRRDPRGIDERVLSALRERGGSASRATLARALAVHPVSVSRGLARLIENGRVRRLDRGIYALRDHAEGLPPTAREIVAALEGAGAEAHLTGFDVLGSHSHQFVHSYPHLVYTDPAGLRDVAFALSAADFVAVPAGAAGRDIIAFGPSPDRLVLLRGQPVGRMDRFGVRGTVAPLEKAWLDLLREVRGGSFPASLGELGAILASMLRGGADALQLRRWAREMGYLPHVDAVIDPTAGRASPDPELRELAAGAIR